MTNITIEFNVTYHSEEFALTALDEFNSATALGNLVVREAVSYVNIEPSVHGGTFVALNGVIEVEENNYTPGAVVSTFTRLKGVLLNKVQHLEVEVAVYRLDELVNTDETIRKALDEVGY